MRQEFDDRAVSPVVGVILVVAITVALAAVIGVFALDLGKSTTDSGTSQELGISTSETAGGETTVTVIAGTADRLELRVNGTAEASIDAPAAGDSTSVSTPPGSDLSVVTVSGGSERIVSSTTVTNDSTANDGPTSLLRDEFSEGTLNESTWTVVNQDDIIEVTNGRLHMSSSNAADDNIVQTEAEFSTNSNVSMVVDIDDDSSSGGYGHKFGFDNHTDGSGEYVRLRYDQYAHRNYWTLETSNGSDSTTQKLESWTSEHEYTITWEPDAVTVHRDGEQIAQVTEGIPQSDLPVSVWNERGSYANSPSDTWVDNVTVEDIE